jgi:hypothetical protein
MKDCRLLFPMEQNFNHGNVGSIGRIDRGTHLRKFGALTDENGCD